MKWFKKSIFIWVLAIALAVGGLAWSAEYGSDRALTSIKAGKVYTETIADGEDGSVFAVPAILGKTAISVRLICGANTGKIRTSTSSDAAVAAGTANWNDWDKGTVTGTTEDVIVGPVTGIYAVSVSGEITVEIVY